MTNVVSIPDGNAFNLRVTGQVKTGDYTEAADFSVVRNMTVNFVRRGREAHSHTIDVNGRIVVPCGGDLPRGVYGVELVGYYNGEPWRFYQKDVFRIVDENERIDPGTAGESVLTYDVVFDVSFGGSGTSPGYVEAVLNAHNNDEAAHPSLQNQLDEINTTLEQMQQAIEDAGDVDDVQVDGQSVLGQDKIARIDSSGFGHVDDVQVNGQSVVSEKVANITVPTKTSELDNDDDFATKSEAQEMAGGKVSDVKVNGSSVVNENKVANITVPTKVSDLENDADYATKTYVDEAKVLNASASVDSNVGTPSVDVTKSGDTLNFAFHGIKGETGTQGPQGIQGVQGDSAVYNPDSPNTPDFEMANTTGQSTTKAMTQKAVTDALAQLSEEYVGVIEKLKVGNDNIETKNTNQVGYRYYICCIKALGESKKIHLEGYMPEGAQWSFQGFSTLANCRNINSSPIESSESYSDSLRVFEFNNISVKYFRLAFKRNEGNLTADQIGQINENTIIYISEASVESAFEAYATVNGKIVYPVSDADFIKYNGSTTVKNELDEHKESIQSLKDNSCFAKEYALSEMTASTPATSRRRYTVRVPSVPMQADIIGVLPSGFNFGLQCNYSLEDAASGYVTPPQQTSWDVHSYYFTAENAYYITIGVKKSNNGNFSESDIETLESSTVKLSLRNFKASENERDGIIGLNKDAERYLKNAKRPEYTGSSYAAMTTPLTLLHFSDIHGDEPCLQRIVEFYTYYAQYIDDAICTGDIIQNIFGDSFAFWENAEAGNILNCTGNHEYYNGESSRPYYKIITQKQVYDKFFAPYIGEWGVTQPENAATNGLNYYYKDYTSNKVRLIVCDNMRVDTAQLNWLASVLADAITKDLHVIAAMHIGNPDEVQYNNAFNTLIPTTGHYTADQWLVDDAELLFDEVDTYIGNGGIFVGWIAGHKHLDTIGVQNGHPNQLIIHIATASSGNAWDIIPKADNCDRTNGTKSQDCFNIYSIDTYRKRIKIHRIGCDIDRDLRHKGNLCYDYENHQVIYVD